MTRKAYEEELRRLRASIDSNKMSWGRATAALQRILQDPFPENFSHLKGNSVESQLELVRILLRLELPRFTPNPQVGEQSVRMLRLLYVSFGVSPLDDLDRWGNLLTEPARIRKDPCPETMLPDWSPDFQGYHIRLDEQGHDYGYGSGEISIHPITIDLTPKWYELHLDPRTERPATANDIRAVCRSLVSASQKVSFAGPEVLAALTFNQRLSHLGLPNQFLGGLTLGEGKMVPFVQWNPLRWEYHVGGWECEAHGAAANMAMPVVRQGW